MGWSDFFVILAVAAAAAWCIRWVRRTWSRAGGLCACDPGECPAARKMETLAKAASEKVAPSDDEPAKPLPD